MYSCGVEKWLLLNSRPTLFWFLYTLVGQQVITLKCNACVRLHTFFIFFPRAYGVIELSCYKNDWAYAKRPPLFLYHDALCTSIQYIHTQRPRHSTFSRHYISPREYGHCIIIVYEYEETGVETPVLQLCRITAQDSTKRVFAHKHTRYLLRYG